MNNYKIVIFSNKKSLDTKRIVCPKCGYYNSLTLVKQHGFCRRCNFIMDNSSKFKDEVKRRLGIRTYGAKKEELRRKNEELYNKTCNL